MSTKQTQDQWASATALAAETGAGRQYIPRWCGDVPTQRRGQRVLYDRTQALAAIAEHQREGPGMAGAVDTDRPAATIKDLLGRNTLYRRMIGILADASDRIDTAIVNGFAGITEDQARALLVMLGEPWQRCKQLIPAAELAAVEKEAAS